MTQVVAGRWALVLLLLLSLGVNIGVLATLALRPPSDVPSDGAISKTVAELEEEQRAEREDGESGVSARGRSENPRGRGGPPPWGDPGEMEGPIRMLERLMDTLQLEGEDRERFAAIQREMFTALSENRRRARELEAALRAEVSAAEPDTQRLEEIVDQMALNFGERNRTLVKGVLASREILNEEQQRKYGRFLSFLNRGPEGRGGMERRGDRRGSYPRQRYSF
ncbi:MAG: periplasmic heavy metal sensor [Acidobacteriota bacterium]